MHRSRHRVWQRSFAAVLTLSLLFAGALPALHAHEIERVDEAHCHDTGHSATTHLETLDFEHHEPCAVCAKSLWSVRLERPANALVDTPPAQSVVERSQLLPPGPPGQNGAARAPPLA